LHFTGGLVLADKKLNQSLKKKKRAADEQEFAGMESSIGEGLPPELRDPADNFLLKIESFEGPLDLLLHLIREQKLDIFNIPIVQITEGYLAYLDIMQVKSIDIAGEYLLMAATLIHIKSRMLLPDPEPEENEDGELVDPREELVQRLLVYQRFKDAAEQLTERPTMYRDFFPRQIETRRSRSGDSELDMDESSLLTLTEMFHDLLEHLSKIQPYEIKMEEFSLENMVIDVQKNLFGKKRFPFKELVGRNPSRFELVATFLSVLELARMKVLRIFQAGGGGEIYMDYRDDAPSIEDITVKLRGAAQSQQPSMIAENAAEEALKKADGGNGEVE